MNLFTRYLRQWNRNRELDDLVEHWNALEALIIRVYKGGEATPADEAEYQAIRLWMGANYPDWQAILRPFWREALVGGQPATEDPFLRLTKVDRADDFVGDWDAMQHLPAAREALNRLILHMSEEG